MTLNRDREKEKKIFIEWRNQRFKGIGYVKKWGGQLQQLNLQHKQYHGASRIGLKSLLR